jgi:hypothetical protein
MAFEVDDFVDALGLGKIDCKYPGDYTSNQLLLVLDKCIFNACLPILKHTKFFDDYLAKLMVQIFWCKDRHKICAIDKQLLIKKTLLVLSGKKRSVNFRGLKIERSYLLAACKDFLNQTSQYADWVAADINDYSPENARNLSNLRKRVFDNGTQDLWTTIATVQYWFDVSQDYKRFLIGKYLRLAIKRVNALYSKFPQIDRHDLFQNLVMAIDKAISKCDARKGTLTTYINHWMRDAQNWRNSHTQKFNHVSLEGMVENMEQTDVLNSSLEKHFHQEEVHDRIDWVRRCAKYADPEGWGRVELGIQEIF